VHSAGQLPLAFSEQNRQLIDEQAPPALAVHMLRDRLITSRTSG
jgi:hypothetical protein